MKQLYFSWLVRPLLLTSGTALSLWEELGIDYGFIILGYILKLR